MVWSLCHGVEGGISEVVVLVLVLVVVIVVVSAVKGSRALHDVEIE